jgi:microcystin-dependent protein
LKTYLADGSTPNGRLFAGDLNALQDAVAALTDLAQNLSVGTITIGESGLQVVRYGAGEARLIGAFRADGIIRSGTGGSTGGILPPSMTSTERNAIALGSRPTGLVIYNSTTGSLESNIGTDAAPVWSPVGASPTGAVTDYAGATPPTGWLLCDGSAVSRATYAALFTLIGTTYGAGDGSTTFNVPDLRGRVSVGKGSGSGVSTLGSNDGVTEANRRGTKHRHTTHNHTITDTGHTHTLVNPSHTHTITEAVGHQHANTVPSGADPGSGNEGSQNAVVRANTTTGTALTFTSGTATSGATAAATTTAVSANSATTGIVVNATDGGSQVATDPLDGGAYLVLNKIIKT